jgi:hypothetical protein
MHIAEATAKVGHGIAWVHMTVEMLRRQSHLPDEVLPELMGHISQSIDELRGNKPADYPISWADLRILFEKELRSALERLSCE